MHQKWTYKGKYSPELIISVLGLLNQGTQIRTIAKLSQIPETTIRNWKFGYTRVYGNNLSLDTEIKLKILELLNIGLSIPEIAQKLGVNYDYVRLFLIKNLDSERYETIKISNGKIPLGTKDKDFADEFFKNVQLWSRRKPSIFRNIRNNKFYYDCYLSHLDATKYVLDIVGKRLSIPAEILNSNNLGVIASFIKGFSDSEGTFITVERSRAHVLKIYNQKTKILEQVKSLLLKLGFDEEKIYIVPNNKAKNGDVYALRICYRDQLRLFHEKVGFTIKRKREKLGSYLEENL